ncbi:MAG: recombination mediator RecR [Pseudomonadota bacterium]|jgi:recombination protein RecR|nr:recombination mediator RecR [Pseudomonadota bacterium]
MSEVYSPLLAQLIQALQCLPGVGAKSAQRIAFHLLNKDRDGASRLALALEEASTRVGHCERCRMLTEDTHCIFCISERRDGAQLCVVETPADVLAIEQSGAYSGRYFVLMGHLSPIDGIGPKELGLDLLEERFRVDEILEVILATSVTVEGDATAHILATMAQKHGIRSSRIAYGIPMGGELEFIDGGTLSRALTGRRKIEVDSKDESSNR